MGGCGDFGRKMFRKGLSNMDILKRGLSRIKSAFWLESGFSWGRLSIVFAFVLLGSMQLAAMPLPRYLCAASSFMALTTAAALVISFLVFSFKIVAGAKFIQTAVTMGAGPLFFLLFLSLGLGLYLYETAPVVIKYTNDVDFYDQKIKALNEAFSKLALNERERLMDKARKEKEEAIGLYMNARATSEDVASLRDPVKWLTGFCLGTLFLKLIFFFLKNTSPEKRKAWLFKSKVVAVYGAFVLLRLLGFSLVLMSVLSLSTFSPLNSSAITLSAALLAAAAVSFYVLPWVAPKSDIFKILGIEIREKTPEPRKLFWFKWTSRRANIPSSAEIRGITPLLSRFAAVTAASLLVILVTHGVWHVKAETLKQSIKAKGWPSSLADFQTNAPDEQYAGEAIESAMIRIGMGAMDEKTDIALKTLKWDKEIFERQSAFVARQLPLAAKEFSSAIKGRTRWMKADYLAAVKNPFGLQVPKFSDQIKLSKFLRLCACVEAFRGNLPEAWGYVRLQLSIAGLLSSDPSLIAKMSTVVLRRQAALAAVSIMLSRPSAAIPADIAQSLQIFPFESLVSDGMKTEVAKFCDFIAAPLPAEDRNKISRVEYYKGEVWSWILAFTGLTDLSIAKSASYYSELVITTSRYKLFEPWGSKADRELQNLPEWPYFLTKTMTGKFSDLHEKEWEMKAWAQMALVASAAVKYYGAYSRYPGKIRELSPKFITGKMLEDPFSYRDFEYNATAGGKGFSLCSIGPKGNHKNNKELTFCIQQPR